MANSRVIFLHSYAQHTKMNLPDDTIYHLDNFKTENNVYSFTKDQKIIDISNTEIKYHFFNRTDRISPEDYNDYCKDMNTDYRKLITNFVWVEGLSGEIATKKNKG